MLGLLAIALYATTGHLENLLGGLFEVWLQYIPQGKGKCAVQCKCGGPERFEDPLAKRSDSFRRVQEFFPLL